MLNGHHVNFIRPFIRWAGGKQNLIKVLLNNIPSDFSGRYFEPFLGAGSLFFAGNFQEAFLSDINPHLINSFDRVKCDPKRVHKLLLQHRKKFSINYYYKLREEFNSEGRKKTYQQAARFIFLVHTSYNGIYRVNRKGEYNVPVGKIEPNLPSLLHLEKVSSKLKRAELKSRSFEELLSEVKKGDFVYLDPPYPALNGKTQFRQFTIDKFSDTDQNKLAIFSEKLADKGCKVLISNSDVPQIRKLYQKWKISTVPTVRYVSCKSERIRVNELVIKNY